MTVVFVGMLASIVVFTVGAVLTLELIKTARSAALSEMLERRRIIVMPAVITIGIASAVWVIMFVLDVWWNLIRGSPLERIFLPQQLWF
jgi:hypothetical protein